MEGFRYFLDLSDKKQPVLARSGRNGIELFHPANPNKWGKSSFLSGLSPEEFFSTFDECSKEQAQKYMVVISRTHPRG